MDIDLARVNKIPGDWGLEVGVLAEVYRNCSVRRVCQIDIADNYEHKHQALSTDDASKGLLKMCIDISKSIFRTLASEGIIFSDGAFKSLIAFAKSSVEGFIAVTMCQPATITPFLSYTTSGKEYL